MDPRPLALIGLSMAVLTAARFLLYLAYPDQFGALEAGEVGVALLGGIRFDLAVTVWVLGLPLWCMWCPARFARSSTWQRSWGWVAYGLFAALLLVITANLAYFALVGRHMGHDFLVGLFGDPWNVVRASASHPLSWVVYLAIAGGAFMLWRRALRRPVLLPSRPWIGWAWCLALIPLAIVGARGGVDEPLEVGDAFRGRSVEAGYLTLNGPFAIIRSSVPTPRAWPAVHETSEAVRLVRSRIELGPAEAWSGDRFPLERGPPAGAAGSGTGAIRDGRARPNVVLLVFEGLDALVSDAVREVAGVPPLGATPNFDRLAARGILFTRLLGHGQLSVEGIGAILTSFPSIPGLHTYGRKLENTRLSYLGAAASGMGYETFFVRSADRSSFGLDELAAIAGFERFAGREDIVVEIDSHVERPPGPWGAWDFDSLRFLHRRLERTSGPFLALFFGSSSHPPYASPGDRWRRFPDDDDRGRYLNAVGYVDWALGEFMRLAEEGGYLDDTIWVITSDQPSRVDIAGLDPEEHAVPAIVFGPGVPEGRVDTGVASLLDIAPTIIDAAGWPTSHASFGQSLLRPRTPGALLRLGEVLVRVDSTGWIARTFGERLTGEGSRVARNVLERQLLAEVGTLSKLFLENRVFSGRRPR